MVQALYTHRIIKHAGQRCLLIEDLNKGGKTVTNDIENVVEQICEDEQINPVEHIIVYKDSAGVWDGYNFSTKQFMPLVQDNWRDAVETFIEKYQS